MNSAPSRSQEPILSKEWVIFFLRLAGVILIVLCLVAGANVLVNPVGIYTAKIFPTADRNARYWKIALLKNAKPKPRVLILGASNSMKIDPAEVFAVTGETAFNAAVDAAMAEDFYPIVRFAEEDVHADLRLVVIGLDVDSFHDHRPEDIRFINAPYAREYCGVSKWTARWEDFKYLFDRSQAALSEYSVKAWLRRKTEAITQFQANGGLRYNRWEESIKAGTFNLQGNVNGSIAEMGERFKGFDHISPERLKYLEKTLQYCHSRGITVVMYISPMHPMLHQALTNLPALQMELSVAADHLAAEYGGSFMDESDVSFFGGNPSYFYDGIHFDARTAKSLIDTVLRKSGQETDAPKLHSMEGEAGAIVGEFSTQALRR